MAEKSEKPLPKWIVDPPPFGTSSSRFPEVKKKNSPAYHAAYRDIVQPPRWSSKGWVGIDDFIKPRRGVNTSVLGTSSLAQASKTMAKPPALQPLMATHPNETRLQELLNLQKRKFFAPPGPGTYELTGWQPSRSHFRRANDSSADGPFGLPDGVESTRSREISSLLKESIGGDSGIGPGQYDPQDTKDRVVARRAPRPAIGTADRSGSTPHVKSLSMSRSIQRGIDWHVPVVLQPPPQATARQQQQQNPKSESTSPRSSTMLNGNASSRQDPADPRPYSSGMDPYGKDSRNDENRDLSNSSPPRGMAALLPGQPPAPPSNVARAVRRVSQRNPGDWNWESLGFNYRSNWTTLHGGAYSLGDRSTESRAHSAPAAAAGAYVADAIGQFDNNGAGSAYYGSGGSGGGVVGGSGRMGDVDARRTDFMRHSAAAALEVEPMIYTIPEEESAGPGTSGSMGMYGGDYGAGDASSLTPEQMEQLRQQHQQMIEEGTAGDRVGFVNGEGDVDMDPQQQQQRVALYSMLNHGDLRRRRDAEMAAAKALEANARLEQWMYKSVSVV